MTESQKDTTILIIAAGASTRLGSPKQLVKIGNKYLLEKMVETSLNFPSKKVIVVLGAFFEKIKETISHLPVDIIENKNWENGMGGTISFGINYLENNFPEINGTYILLSDQPFVTLNYLEKLKSEKEKERNKIIASKYESTLGPPAFFPKNIFSALKNLNGQKGAKPIFQKYKEETVTVDFPGGAFDIDTPEDLKKLYSLSK